MPASSSIQSYFSPSPSKNSDGFTAEEVQSALLPTRASALNAWTPTLDYEEADLGSLEPAPRHLTLMGRIVNFYDTAKPSKSHRAAQGCLRIMLADDTGVLTVRLWYANTQYKVRLGQLVTLWTVHISNSSDHNSLAPSTASLFTSIFPEGERNCHFMVHENSDDGTQFRRPFNCRDSKALPGLMTLKSFTDGGYDVEEPKLLVCVKSIGARKRYLNRNGTTSELISLGIFDDTADASLTLYGGLCDSASSFQPSQTVLLISNPGWRIDKTAKLSLNGHSRVDIDPDLGDARRLRALAVRLTKKEHVNPPFPDIDVSGFETAAVRPLYTLADVDDFARSNPTENLLGYLSVVMTQLDIVTPFKRNMLMSNECCGIPVFANSVTATCKQCDKVVALRINPRILGPIIDETGQISTGKLIFSPSAWAQLLGRTADRLVATEVDTLRYLEQRLDFLRVTMGFVLCLEGGIGRLGVWWVGN
ncbi:Nn.00g102070.m01.CDS01 [Neocucurbitaria sp. VM-36]